MSNMRYEIQHFDFANGGRSWHVYDNIERYHIHTATHGFLNDDNSEPVCCTKICAALNAIEMNKITNQSMACSKLDSCTLPYKSCCCNGLPNCYE